MLIRGGHPASIECINIIALRVQEQVAKSRQCCYFQVMKQNEGNIFNLFLLKLTEKLLA